MGSGSSNFGVMMTLAQLSALSPDQRPSGETPQAQAQRILTGINSTLQDTTLATAGLWSAAWLALTQDRGNLCYIATSTQGGQTQPSEYAVCCRGTQFNSLVDLGEDLEVAHVAQFTPGGNPAPPPLLVAQGSMKAFAEATNALGLLSGSTSLGPNLLGALSQMVSQPGISNPTIYITGHSLGGAMATMIALYLAGQPASTWGANTPSFQVYTFAAPTAGLASFASYYNQIFAANSWRVYNAWDAVPYAWQNLKDVQKKFYPAPSHKAPNAPGPYETITVRGLLSKVEKLPNGNEYIQTNVKNNSQVLNNGVYVPDPVTNFQHPTTEDFFGQIGYQHNCYLQLIGAPVLPAAGAVGGPPQVTMLSANNGPEAGGTNVTITGGNFTSDCVVDFGTVAATVLGFTPTTISVTQPAGTGTVDIRVTNEFGTSAVTSADQFAAPPPVAPTVVSVTPIAVTVAGIPTYQVQIVGTGFVIPSTTSVSFGAAGAGTNVTVVSLTEILVTPPQATSGTLVDVQVTNDLGTSAVTPGDKFLFGTPIVTSLSPSSGPETDGQPVTISGLGFVPGCTVNFDKKPVTPPDSDVTPTSIVVTPPPHKVRIKSGLANPIVNVTVMNPGGPKSAKTPNDLYMYYSVPKFGSGN